MPLGDEFIAGAVLSPDAQQELLNSAIYRIIEERGGQVELSLDDMKPDDMGGVAIEANFDGRTITLRTVTREQMDAWYEASRNQKQ